MGRAGITVNAAVLAPAIRIHAGLESDVGTVVARNDRLRAIAVEDGFPRARILIDFIVRILFKMQRLEPVRWINRRASRVEFAGMDRARAALGISRTFFQSFFPSGNGLTAYVQLNIIRCRGIFCSRGPSAAVSGGGIQPRPATAGYVELKIPGPTARLAQRVVNGTLLERKPRRGGRVVDGSGLENRQGASPRGFESHPLRQLNCGVAIADCGLKASEQRATHRSRPESRRR